MVKPLTPEEKRLLLKAINKLVAEGKVALSVNDKGETLVTLIKKEDKE